MKSLLALIVLLIPGNALTAGYWHDYFGNSKGVIYQLEKPGNWIFPFYFPDKSVPVFKNGQQIGHVKRKLYENSGQVLTLFLDNGEEYRIQKKDSVNFEYEFELLKYYDQKDGYIKILEKTYQGGAWIRLSDLEGNFPILTWRELVVQLNYQNWFVSTKMGLNLRDQPDSLGNKIITMASFDDDYAIELLEYQGLWAKVKITHYKVHPCHAIGVEINKIYEGWIKFMDNAGYPNIWFKSKGC